MIASEPQFVLDEWSVCESSGLDHYKAGLAFRHADLS
jgi:hypothetical protein